MVEAVMAAVGLDQEGPFLELGVAGEERGLEGEERGVGVVWWEGERDLGGGGEGRSASEIGRGGRGHETIRRDWSCSQRALLQFARRSSRVSDGVPTLHVFLSIRA